MKEKNTQNEKREALLNFFKHKVEKYEKAANIEEVIIAEEDEAESTRKYGAAVRVLKEGDMLGEIALNQKGGRRTATIICKTECHFFTLTEQDYKASLEVTIQKEKSDKVDLVLLAFPAILQYIHDSTGLEMIINSLKEVRVPQGSELLSEGLPNGRVYLLREGQLSLSKRLTRSLCDDLKDLKLKPKLRLYRYNPERLVEYVARSTSIAKPLKLSVVNPGEVLNYEEALLGTGQPSFTYTVVSRTASLYSLKIEEFCSFVPPAMINQLKIKYEHVHYKRHKAVLEMLEQLVKVGNMSLHKEEGNLPEMNLHSVRDEIPEQAFTGFESRVQNEPDCKPRLASVPRSQHVPHRLSSKGQEERSF